MLPLLLLASLCYQTCTPPNRAVISQCFCLSNGASMRCVEGIVLQRQVSYCVSSNWTRDFLHSSRYNVPECNSKQSTKENISHLPLFHLPPCFHLFSVSFFPTVQIWSLIFSSVVPLNNSATHLSCSGQMINWSEISYEVLWMLVWVKTVQFPPLFLLGQASFWCIQLFPLLFSVPVVKTWWRSPWMCLCAACSQIAMSCGSRAKTAQCWITSNPQSSAAQNWRAGGNGA